MRKSVASTVNGVGAASSLGKKAARTLKEEGEIKVVLAGLCNVYTHYIATFEEYQRQRYEAASTIFGPHTLAAYQQQYSRLAKKLINVSPPLFSTFTQIWKKRLPYLPGMTLSFRIDKIKSLSSLNGLDPIETALTLEPCKLDQNCKVIK